MHIIYNSEGKNDCQKINSTFFLQYNVNINGWLFSYSLLSRIYTILSGIISKVCHYATFYSPLKPETKHLETQLCYIDSFTVNLPADINIIPQRVQFNG